MGSSTTFKSFREQFIVKMGKLRTANISIYALYSKGTGALTTLIKFHLRAKAPYAITKKGRILRKNPYRFSLGWEKQKKKPNR